MKFSLDSLDFYKNEKKDNIAKNYVAYIVLAALSVLVFAVYYRYSYGDIEAPGLSDMTSHTEWASNIYMKKENFLEVWGRFPYLAWHLQVKFFQTRMNMPLSAAAGLVNGLYGMSSLWMSYYFIYRVSEYYLKKDAKTLAAILAGALSFVGPLYMWWYNAEQYLGQFSINPIHNPTHMAAKGIGLLATMAGIDIFRMYKGEECMFFTPPKKWNYIYLVFGIALFLTDFTKPTYVYMLLPAGFIYFIYLVVSSAVKKKLDIKNAVRTLVYIIIASLPAIIYTIVQYYALYNLGTWDTVDSKMVLSKPFEVWHMFAYNVPTSVILGMIFPIWMFITNIPYYLQKTEGLLSFLCYVVGTAEFSFITETGGRASHANLAWCMMAGMFVFFVSAAARLAIVTKQGIHKKRQIFLLVVSWILLFLQLYAGMYFISSGGFATTYLF